MFKVGVTNIEDVSQTLKQGRLFYAGIKQFQSLAFEKKGTAPPFRIRIIKLFKIMD